MLAIDCFRCLNGSFKKKDSDTNSIVVLLIKNTPRPKLLRFLYHTQLDNHTLTHPHTHTQPAAVICTKDQIAAEAATNTTNERDGHVCLQRESNPLSQQ
jgi:hypothetical protein